MSLNQKHLPFFIAVLLGIGIYIGSKLSTNTSSRYVSSKNISKQKLNTLYSNLWFLHKTIVQYQTGNTKQHQILHTFQNKI